MKPAIGVGTELSIGVVVAINHDGVTLDYNGLKVNASFRAVERAWEDAQNNG